MKYEQNKLLCELYIKQITSMANYVCIYKYINMLLFIYGCSELNIIPEYALHCILVFLKHKESTNISNIYILH